VLTAPVELKTNERLLRVRIDFDEVPLDTNGEIPKLPGFKECLRRTLRGCCMRIEVVILVMELSKCGIGRRYIKYFNRWQ
jgi:hypothetical protein